MASLCRKQKCMTERRGDRQALNSWWCKFFHCVGLENILEWLSGSGLLEDLQLFKNCEPAGVSDWSFDENCVFCCLRREAVKEHLLDANSQISGSGRKPLLFEDLSSISRFEWQTEEFLNAVFSRKSDPPRFPDPHIPVVAREIMHRMVRQFAAEYTSKTSFSQASPHRNGNKDQSLVKACSVVSPPPTAAALATASASTHNPVLTRLLMDDQDSPLDLTVKKVEVEIFEQDGVLDLSTKKNRNRESVSFRTPHVSTTTPVVKGDSRDRSLAKVRGLQSASALEQVMAKLCSHHQRQIVDALGFLQTEVKAVASSSGLHPSTSKPVSEEAKTSDCCHVPLEQSSETRQSEEQVGLTASKDASDLKEAAALKNNKWVTVKCPPNTDDSVMVQGYTGPPLDLSNTHISKVLTSPLSCTDSESVSPKGLSPIKIKLRSGAASHRPLNTGTLEENLCNPSPLLQTNNGELHAEPSSVLERDGLSQSPRFKGQRIPAGHTKDTPVRPGAVQRISSAVSPISPRTARKSRRGSYLRPRDGSVCHVINDPDSNCDIVYIGKPITECQVESESRMLPRRNARKSTRGHRYIEEYWELKTVRTLAHKSAGNGSGNCPAPMPDIITLVTPKQALTKPDGVPPLNMPFTGDCMETVIQKATDKPIEREMPGDVVTAVSDEDLVVETSQTGQTQNIDQVLTCPSTASSFAGEEYNGNVPQELLTEEHFANRTPKPADLEDLNMLQVSGNEEKEPSPRQSRVDPSGDPLREPMPDDLPSVAESENQSSTAEAPSSMSLNQTEVDSTDAKSKGANVSLKEKNLLRDTQGEVQSHCVKSVTELLASKEENVQLHKTCETETSLVHSDGDKLTEEKVMITEISKEPDKEATIKETPESHEKLEKPELKQPQCAITKKGSGRRVLTSDRCLRSKVLTNFPDTAKVSSPPGVSTLEEVHSTDSQDASLKTSESKSPLKYFNSKQEEAVLPSPDNQNDAFQNESEKGLEKEVKTSENVVMDNRLRTRQKHKSVPIKAIEMDKEQQVSDKQSPKQTMTICRWFLQSTETKSLVIVKKVNTRLPSETQLCFHTSAAVPGSSHSVFPSVQAERLKKHLKKFAIASPVKSNPKSQKLIAKALARDMSVVKGKEKRELTSATRISTKPNKPYAGMTQAQIPESQKAAASVKNPASARILRKYSNMRSLSKSKETSVQGIKVIMNQQCTSGSVTRHLFL
ncbi:uncharacterized protein LOC115810310 [Chanos chanos]|uniref:Uncharacterized protein LOC115810310 n=1 Tax=Chanos chanos TaxID=29144 RepID=A0A6J2V8F3_CHACN|nr:uncharacterized protein LOC115810310 [Chanos chanos]